MERKFRTPRTVDEVFEDYRGRRQGMLRALTADKGILHQLCDPGDQTNLCLYSYPDGSWQVSSPAEEIPSELPEPCLGINFARDGMTYQDWLSLVAAHSDSWLYGVTFFYTKNFSKQERADLFDMINSLPTLFEVVTGQASAKQNGTARSGANTTMPDIRRDPVLKEEVDEESEGKEDEDEQEEEAYCGACQGSYSSSSSQFWILCDVCNRWFHGKCVKVTAAKAEQIDKYRCPSCIKKRSHP